jgi:hypothetical protein
MGVTAEIFLASILLKEMRYLVYIRYLWCGVVVSGHHRCLSSWGAQVQSLVGPLLKVLK